MIKCIFSGSIVKLSSQTIICLIQTSFVRSMLMHSKLTMLVLNFHQVCAKKHANTSRENQPSSSLNLRHQIHALCFLNSFHFVPSVQLVATNAGAQLKNGVWIMEPSTRWLKMPHCSQSCVIGLAVNQMRSEFENAADYGN